MPPYESNFLSNLVLIDRPIIQMETKLKVTSPITFKKRGCHANGHITDRAEKRNGVFT